MNYELSQGFDTPLQVFSSKPNASIGGLDAASRCQRHVASVTLQKTVGNRRAVCYNK
jgi:hypothetical protein